MVYSLATAKGVHTSGGGLQVPLAGGGSSVFDTTGFCGDVMIGLPPLT